MKHIQAPKYFSSKDTKVFLAGSIEMGVAEMWQERVVKMFGDADITVLNPRRDDWDSSWVQSKDNAQFNEQVSWELQGLEDSDYIIVYFDPQTKAPITLLELGLVTGRDNDATVLVVCPEGFYRKGNVDIVCERYGITQCDSLEEAVRKIKRWEDGDPQD